MAKMFQQVFIDNHPTMPNMLISQWLSYLGRIYSRWRMWMPFLGGLCGGLCGWHMLVAYAGGLCRWLMLVAYVGGLCRWHMQVAYVGALCRWLMQVAYVGAFCRCLKQVAYVGAFVGALCRWLMQMAYVGGICSWYSRFQRCGIVRMLQSVSQLPAVYILPGHLNSFYN